MNERALKQSLAYLSSWLQYRYDQDDIPGFIVTVAHKGQLIFNEAYGYADLETKTELTPQHMWRIASQSKTFTATAVMQLQEAGKLQIDSHVVDYLPWLKEHADPRWQSVTIRQILSHGAGIERDSLDADFWQLERPYPDEQEIITEILARNLTFDPGTKMKYSSISYALLGLLVKEVSGIAYNEYVQEHIIEPLNLKNTGSEYSPAIEEKLATGYTKREYKRRLPIKTSDTKAMSPATGAYSTAEDLCTFFSAQMIGSGKLLNDESKEDMQREHYKAVLPGVNADVGEGLGINIENFCGRKLIGYGGGYAGLPSKTLADSDNELVIVVLANSMDAPRIAMAKGVYQVIDYFQKHSGEVESKTNLLKLAGRYTNLWGINDIIVLDDKVLMTSPDSWFPLISPQELERIDDTTFRFIAANSVGLEGELMSFTIKGGSVEYVKMGGQTNWPEAVWAERQRQRKIVE
jgi:D-alanyl-D-alanine carboxypeptidase